MNERRLGLLPGWARGRLPQLLIGFAILNGLYNALAVLKWLSPSGLFAKDFLQEYVLVRAIADGADPYLTTQTLADRYLVGSAYTTLDHPTPHPPTVGLLVYPLAFLDYPAAATVWLALEIVFLAVAVYLLGRLASVRLSLGWTSAITIIALGWCPVGQELQRGQFSILLLLLLSGFWLALRSNRPLLAGVLAGLSIVVKQVAWPVLLLLLIRRKWCTLTGSAAIIALGYALAAWIVGPDALVRYFTAVLPEVSGDYRNFIWNHSLWTVGYRLFDGTVGIVAPPLVESPSAALITSALVPALAMLFAVYFTRSPLGLDWALGVMLCMSAVVNPVAWPHYVVVVLPSAVLVARWLAVRGLPRRETSLALLAAALLWTGHPQWEMLASALAGQTPSVLGSPAVLPFAPALLLMGPSIAAIAFAWLLVVLGHQDRVSTAPLPGALCAGAGKGRASAATGGQ